MEPMLDETESMGAALDWKTSLQELTSEMELGVPEYMIEESGPDHNKAFVARVRLADYFVDRYEVSNTEYKEFVSAGGYLVPRLNRQQRVER